MGGENAKFVLDFRPPLLELPSFRNVQHIGNLKHSLGAAVIFLYMDLRSFYDTRCCTVGIQRPRHG